VPLADCYTGCCKTSGKGFAMFEETRLLGTPRDGRKIIVQTQAGTDLENFVGPEPNTFCRSRFGVLLKNYGANWEVRKPPSGGYNCAGMVWANRRTSLPSPDDWERILDEDGYRQLAAKELVNLGDVVVYWATKSNEILHVARICRLDRLVLSRSSEGKAAPRALSKWDLTSGEVIHAIDDVHLNGGESFTANFFTDRPAE